MTASDLNFCGNTPAMGRQRQDLPAQTQTMRAFTPRERDVLCELAKNQTNKQIGKTLMLSPETVKHHLKAIFAKLGMRRRENVVTEARRRAFIP